MRVVRKVIFRRFRISNQIFDSLSRSRDIRLSLDQIFENFKPNLTFRDEYLENQIFPGGPVFAEASNLISTTIFIDKKYLFNH